MKVVIAIDSLKGSLTSMEAGYAIKEGIIRGKPEAQVVVKPLADGGEGTTEALVEGLSGERIDITVTGPLKKPVSAYYGYLKESNTAIIEMAQASGIMLLTEQEKAPYHTTSYGVGEMIKDAILRGCRNFIIGIGGSATNDGGIGMLKALGVQFKDKDGNDVGDGGQALEKVHFIDCTNLLKELADCHFRVACDVNNPLCGQNGATYIYGPQKGVTAEEKEKLDQDMKNYALVTAQTIGVNHQETPGAGAAGGLGFAFLSYLGAELVSGVSLILQAINLGEELRDADIVITGEGCLDYQTAMGKAPMGVARLAKEVNENIRVIAFAGSVTEDASACNEAVDAFFPIIRGITTLEEAMEPQNAKENMIATVEQVFRLL